ncbi:hypothetical protein CIT292_06779 [Citrobacter youngae ATCC 29220]|uniref:Uncharacterized protein n=1 Tax=Citrobacter youngae ATCC 29220 TaxID=500640 RepID=D4B6E1_9ENTR|nr:hypothetical protein CIT292_06779 [Citrobacter youngae ATCC 29220]
MFNSCKEQIIKLLNAKQLIQPLQHDNNDRLMPYAGNCAQEIPC